MSKSVRDIVMQAELNGMVVYLGVDGAMESPLKDFIAQQVDGLLYDLCKLPEEILSRTDDRRWVNDYACQLVIKELKARCAQLEEAVKVQKAVIDKLVGEMGDRMSDERCEAEDFKKYPMSSQVKDYKYTQKFMLEVAEALSAVEALKVVSSKTEHTTKGDEK